MKKNLFIIIILGLFFALSVNAAGVVYPEGTGLPDSSVKNVLENVLKWLLGIIGIIAILGFAISGTQYILAQGDPKEAEKAKNTMIYSATGVVVALLGLVAVATIDFVLNDGSGGVGSGENSSYDSNYDYNRNYDYNDGNESVNRYNSDGSLGNSYYDINSYEQESRTTPAQP